MKKFNVTSNMDMLWFNFFLALNFASNSLSFIAIPQNKGKIKFNPRIKLTTTDT